MLKLDNQAHNGAMRMHTEEVAPCLFLCIAIAIYIAFSPQKIIKFFNKSGYLCGLS